MPCVMWHATVTDFSKATGDFATLSRTDLRVMALAYQLEVELKGKAHLHAKPRKVRLGALMGMGGAKPAAHLQACAGVGVVLCLESAHQPQAPGSIHKVCRRWGQKWVFQGKETWGLRDVIDVI